MRAAVATLDEALEPGFQGQLAAGPGEVGEPDLVLAFLPAGGATSATLEALERVWPESLRLGCESNQQFADGAEDSSGRLLLFWLENAQHRIWAEVLEVENGQPRPELQSMDSVLRSLATAESLLLLSDGLRFPVQWLLAALHDHFPSTLPNTIGALASHDPSGGGPGARVFLHTTLYPRACLLVGFIGVALETHQAHDWQPASPVYTISAAKGNELYAIDGEPAVEWYRRFFTVDGNFAPMPHTAYSFPLIIEGPDPSRRGLCRSLRFFDQPKGGATFWADLRAGDQIRLAIRSPRAPGWNREGFLAACAQAEAAILFSCVARSQTLSTNCRRDASILRETLGKLPWIGCDTFGEFAPPPNGPTSESGLAQHNQNAILAFLREGGV